MTKQANELINDLRAENELLKLKLKNQDTMITASLGVVGHTKKAAFELGYHPSMEVNELEYIIETARASAMVNQKNVELMVMVNSLKYALAKCRFDSLNQSISEWAEIQKAFEQAPSQCLNDVKADAGRAGFVAGYMVCNDGSPLINHNYEASADQYAAKIRNSEVK